MTFATSTAPDITEGIPSPLSSSQKVTVGASASGVKFDVTVGGIGFLAAASDQRPYVRQTAPVQKQQVDTSKEAGEQTLDGEWLRSQTSWHRGAGVRFYEPGSDPASQYRFDDSLGVDVFTRDRVTLLKSCAVLAGVAAGQAALVTGAVVSNTDTVFTNENGSVKRYGYSPAVYTAPASGSALTPVALAGAKILVGTATAIAVGNSTGTALTDLWTAAPSAPTPHWAKSRIVASTANSLWDLTLVGGAWPATALHTHPDTGWVWSDVAESPAAILAAGHSNGRSAIYKFTLEDAASGSTPDLSQAYQAAEFPLGEEVLSIHVHLGTFIAIGTTRGLRIGVVADNGDIQYGPLLMQGVAVRALTSSDRFVYGAVTAAHPDGKSGLVCVDLSEEITAGSLQFPYAWHARTGTAGRVDSVAMYGASGRVTLGVFGEGAYLQSDTAYEATGWVRSGRVRYSTVAVKKFRTADLGVDIPDGAIGLFVVQPDGDEVFVRNLTVSSENGRNISLASGSDQPEEYLQFKVSLTSGSGQTPVLDSLQIRAVPTPTRQELIQYPLLCMDRETTSTGVRYGRQSEPGKPGHAFTRFDALKTLERTQSLVTVSDRETAESYQAQIESVEFRRPGPPSTDGRPNWGGYIMLTVRKFD
jgi:hypothetical protein